MGKSECRVYLRGWQPSRLCVGAGTLSEKLCCAAYQRSADRRSKPRLRIALPSLKLNGSGELTKQCAAISPMLRHFPRRYRSKQHQLRARIRCRATSTRSYRIRRTTSPNFCGVDSRQPFDEFAGRRMFYQQVSDAKQTERAFRLTLSRQTSQTRYGIAFGMTTPSPQAFTGAGSNPLPKGLGNWSEPVTARGARRSSRAPRWRLLLKSKSRGTRGATAVCELGCVASSRSLHTGSFVWLPLTRQPSRASR